MPKKFESPVSVEQIDRMIRAIRGVRVMLDRDLAKIYGVPTKAFNQAVKRNQPRFPEDFLIFPSSFLLFPLSYETCAR